MEQVIIQKMDELTIKLLHYFITNQGYSPIVLQGADNEIWLEKLGADYQIIRIVSNYIHNDEQFNFDLFKTSQIVKRIKYKTLSFKMQTLSIFVNIGENVLNKAKRDNNIDFVFLNNESDLKKYNFLKKYFPNIMETISYKEKGMDLFLHLTNEINKKGKKDAEVIEKIFKPKKPIITVSIILINLIVFLFTAYMSGNIGNINANVLATFGGVYNGAPWWTNITAIFLHSGLIHFVLNNYAIYIIGSQIESFYGKSKYIAIYLISGIIGNLLSVLLLPSNTVGIGASGAILGLMGALLYFGYNYRVYLSNVLKNQIIPLIVINIVIAFLPGIGLYAHLGGLIGGVFTSMAIGFNDSNKQNKITMINGYVITGLILLFLIYMNYFR